MRRPSSLVQLALAAIGGALIAGGGYALAASNANTTIHGCVVQKTHTLLIQQRCHKGQRSLTWNKRGLTGPTGTKGATGAIGGMGSPGAPGQSAVSLWIQSDPSGNEVGGAGLKVSQLGTGEYTLSASSEPPSLPGTCAVTVTPFNSSVLPPTSAIAASVAFAGSGYSIFLTDQSGTPVDDGFSAAVQC